MLQHMAERSAGATVRVNCALAVSNAGLAGALAAALAKRERA
jgi:pseudouridine-5'-phosphate glycosidase